MILICCIRFIIDGYFIADTANYLLIRLAIAAFRVSLFCTCLLSFDRYIAVSCALRYHQIVTRERLSKGISCFWVLSLLLIPVSFVLKERSKVISFFKDGIGIAALNITLIFVTSIIILFVAAYSIIIRKKHIAIIKSRTAQSGVDA